MPAVARKLEPFLKGWCIGHVAALLFAEACSEWIDLLLGSAISG